MSQSLYPANIRLCRDCGCEIDIGKKQSRTRCNPCIYQSRKITLKLKRLKQKKCHHCGGRVEINGVYCSEYCRWLGGLKRRHYKIIRKLEDLR